jgi:hypothetical protein
MVLDAVARIEQNLAAQKNAAPDDELADALAAIRSAVDEARIAASEAIDGLVLEEALAPIRSGAQIIRETLLKLREIGADGRIYDLMDSQVSAIEAGCGRLAAADAQAALHGAFDLIEARIARFASDDAAMPAPVSEPAPSSSAISGEATPTAVAEAASPPGVESEPAAEVTATSPPEPVVATAETNVEMADAETALDDALDMIALEMAAPDFSEDDAEMFGAIQPEPAEPIVVARVAETAIAPNPASEPEPSLGASLIASGIVRRPDTSVADPLAPIRRMSQAEKIAFFS